MSIQTQKRLFSVVEYQKMAEVGILPERGVELINGEIFEKSPKGSRHVKTVTKLNRLLGKRVGDEAIISIHNPFIADNNSEPEPDIAILKNRTDFYENELPHSEDVLLIIEVADTSFYCDSTVKLPLYASSGIPECWIIDLGKKEIHSYWEPIGDAYRFSVLVGIGDEISTQYFDLNLSVGAIFE
jgi:Uma2 family endonuclease